MRVGDCLLGGICIVALGAPVLLSSAVFAAEPDVQLEFDLPKKENCIGTSSGVIGVRVRVIPASAAGQYLVDPKETKVLFKNKANSDASSPTVRWGKSVEAPRWHFFARFEVDPTQLKMNEKVEIQFALKSKHGRPPVTMKSKKIKLRANHQGCKGSEKAEVKDGQRPFLEEITIESPEDGDNSLGGGSGVFTAFGFYDGSNTVKCKLYGGGATVFFEGESEGAWDCFDWHVPFDVNGNNCANGGPNQSCSPLRGANNRLLRAYTNTVNTEITVQVP